jgi:UDP-glucose 4-epimerase
VVESVKAPADNFHPNVEGTFNVLDAAREQGVARVIFASTGGALIGEAEPPVNEQSLPKPISPYGASKLCGEAYCHAFRKAYDLETVALRFGNVYGPCSAHKKGAVTAFIKAVAHDRPMVIYGDGLASRDFLYADDLCQGIEKAIPADVANGSVFRAARPAEVSRNFARYDLAREYLGFEPAWSLAEGLEATWGWFRAQGDAAFQTEESDA